MSQQRRHVVSGHSSIAAAALCIACVSTDALAARAGAVRVRRCPSGGVHAGGVYRGGAYHGGVAWRGGVYRGGATAAALPGAAGLIAERGYAREWPLVIGAAAVGAAALGAAAANPYNNLYNYYNGDYYNGIGARCGYAPYPPCY